jgi:hypothetical protein
MPANPLTNHSRRTLLRAAAVGTATAGVWGAARALGIGDAGDAAAFIDSSSSAPVLAYVRDAAKGEVVVMKGGSEIVRRDARLAARLIAIAREAGDVVA